MKTQASHYFIENTWRELCRTHATRNLFPTKQAYAEELNAIGAECNRGFKHYALHLRNPELDFQAGNIVFTPVESSETLESICSPAIVWEANNADQN